MKTISELLKNPTQDYQNFQDWESDFRKSYLENNPRIVEGDLLFDKHFNTTVNKTYNNFLRAKNGEPLQSLNQPSENENAYWAAREAVEKSLAVQNAGKTTDQIIMESMQATTEKLQQEKLHERQEATSRIGALREIFNACNPLPSNRFKK